MIERFIVVYDESIERELKIRCIHECRCDERLQTKTKKFTREVDLFGDLPPALTTAN